MGEVYLARDTQLGRQVALKVLPDLFAADTERVARLRREAQLLAALHHPNIAVIHGLEESPADGRSVRALVLEYIDGDTLAERIAGGPLALDEALPLALEIGEALQAAHDQGIIHRDLKPSNIKVTPAGSVKVLDFGLAKLAAPAEALASASSSVSLSPTITGPAATTLGVILGTAAYMAPEQAKGKTVDKRCDVWAFGCVLFEMLTGTRAFQGDDVSDTLASVLKGEPDWTALPADIPVPIKTLLRGCLTKDPRARVADIGAALFVLKNSGSLVAPASPMSPSVARPRVSWRRVASMALLWAASIVISGWVGWALRPDAQPPVVTRYGITLPEGAAFSNVGRNLIGVSPDGKLIAFVSDNRVNIRPADRLEARPLRGTEGPGGAAAPRGPFFSPDSQWVAFSTGTQLKKISVNDGAAQVLATFPNSEMPTGAFWSDDGKILYAGAAGIWRVLDTGGTPELLIKDDKRRLVHPQLLPGGRFLLFSARPVESSNNWDLADIIVRNLDDGSEQRIATGTSARYVPTGHVVFVVRGVLTALAFDLRSMRPLGGPIPLEEGIVESPLQNGVAHFDVSGAGTLAFVTAAVATPNRTPVWIDRQGRETPLGADARTYLYPRLSPDQSRVVFDIANAGNRDLWVWDVTQGAMRPLTTGPESERAPLFTPDSSRIIHSIAAGPASHLVVSRSADGVGEVHTLLKVEQSPMFLSSIAPDGTLVLGRANSDQGGGFDVYSLASGSGAKPGLLIRPESFTELNAEVSHDGRWLAYQTNRSDRFEVLVRPYPAMDREIPVSTAGGTEPLWSADGTELFFRSPSGAIMRVVVKPGKEWSASVPEQVLPGEGLRLGGAGNPLRTYDVSRDGRRFLVLKESAAQQGAIAGPAIIVAEEWLEELKRRVAVK